MVDDGGILDWWFRPMEWWLVVAGGGVVMSPLHQIMSVRIVFGGLCDDPKLELRGVHQDHHDHCRPCARTIGFSAEMVVGSLVLKEKCTSRAHETMVFVMEIACRWRAEFISLRNPTNRQRFLSKIQRTANSKKIGTFKPNSAVHEPLVFE